MHKIYAELRALSLEQILLALAGVVLSYLAVTGYDTLALRYAGKPLAYARTAFASFTSYALSNTLGLPLLTGSAVRYRLYSSWGLGAKEIGILAIITGVTLYVGALAIGGAGLLVEAPRFETVFHIPAELAYLLGAACLAAVGTFLFLAGQKGRTRHIRSVAFTTPGLLVATGQLLVSMADWAGASLVLFAVLPPDTGLSYLAFLPVFVAACFIGGISGLPGGVGVFEAVILLMVPTQSNEALAASLIAYRVLYYLIPLGVAAVLLAMHQVPRAGAQLKGAAARAQDITEIFAPTLFSVIAFVAGAFMLISATTPTLAGPLEAAGRILPLPVIELSHFLASIVGVLLLIVALGLRQKLDHAWTIGMILLVLGIGLTLLKGADPHEAVLLAVSLGLLATSRKAFYRKTPLSQARLTLPWILAILGAISAAVWLGFFSYEHVAYRDELWWSFSVNGQTSRFLRATAALPIVLLLVSLWRWLQPAIGKGIPSDPVDPATRSHPCFGHSASRQISMAPIRYSTLFGKNSSRSRSTWVSRRKRSVRLRLCRCQDFHSKGLPGPACVPATSGPCATASRSTSFRKARATTCCRRCTRSLTNGWRSMAVPKKAFRWAGSIPPTSATFLSRSPVWMATLLPSPT